MRVGGESERERGRKGGDARPWSSEEKKRNSSSSRRRRI
jgi:hypothetical protein